MIGGLRRSSNTTMPRLEALGVAKEIDFVDLDLVEMTNILRTLDKVQPDEIYNLAAQSFVGLSFEQPIYTADVDAIGPMRLLEAVRQAVPGARHQASTSEMYGKVQATPQDERTPFYPRSPYGIAKLFAHWATVNYRESYEIGASSGILFNTQNYRYAGANSSLARSPGRWPRSDTTNWRFSNLAISTPSAIGVCRRLCRGYVADNAA